MSLDTISVSLDTGLSLGRWPTYALVHDTYGCRHIDVSIHRPTAYLYMGMDMYFGYFGEALLSFRQPAYEC